LADTDNIIVGSSQSVTEKLISFYEQAGGFGVLNLHTGRDYATPDKLVQSMTMFMREVAPTLRELGPDAAEQAIKKVRYA
jgi:hypothetical protein